MTSNLLKTLLLIAVEFVPILPSEAQSPSTAPAPVFCNVFAGAACFEIRDGETLTMSLGVDYTLYKIYNASNQVATIYVGYNPSPIDNSKVEFGACEDNLQRFAECKFRRKPDGSAELLARTSPMIPWIHIVFSESYKGVVGRFLSSLVPCARTKNDISCS